MGSESSTYTGTVGRPIRLYYLLSLVYLDTGTKKASSQTQHRVPYAPFPPSSRLCPQVSPGATQAYSNEGRASMPFRFLCSSLPCRLEKPLFPNQGHLLEGQAGLGGQLLPAKMEKTTCNPRK